MTTRIAKEERRKRITGRSMDRMALIKGEIPTLESSSSFNKYGEIQSPSSTITSHGLHEGSEIEEDNTKKKGQGKSIVQKVAKKTHEDVRRQKFNFFSSRHLNTCIITSETTRSFCALMIALLVVLSYVDYPLFGRNIVRSEGVVASRPLYILLLTDLTIVLVRLYQEASKGDVDHEEKVAVPGVAVTMDNWAGAEKVLERGLVVYQTVRGVFIDCSVYIVVVICGLSYF